MDLDQAAQELRSGRQAKDAAMDNARQAAVAAINDGTTEVEVARRLNVNRLTVRKWIGK